MVSACVCVCVWLRKKTTFFIDAHTESWLLWFITMDALTFVFIDEQTFPHKLKKISMAGLPKLIPHHKCSSLHICFYE